MAKRRRLSAPDELELRELDKQFDAMPALETKSMVPPIAQVAGDVAAQRAMEDTEDRIELERDRADAAKLREADRAGLLATQIPLTDIYTDQLSRDRLALDREQLDELKTSIRNHGQRTPVEVMQTEDGFGLISGWRRLCAMGELLAETGDTAFAQVRAFVRVPDTASDAYVAMVEENEIRASLSHYERGRVAAVAAGQGVFDTVEDAVNQLFGAASKAKRSKIRSFAAIHDLLGDLLAFPSHLSERQGLQLASAVRSSGAAPFRAALAARPPQAAEEEWGVLKTVIANADGQIDPSRGGRPSRGKLVSKLDPLPLASGGTVSATVFEDRMSIEISGQSISPIDAREMLKRLQSVANWK